MKARLFVSIVCAGGLIAACSSDSEPETGAETTTSTTTGTGTAGDDTSATVGDDTGATVGDDIGATVGDDTGATVGDDSGATSTDGGTDDGATVAGATDGDSTTDGGDDGTGGSDGLADCPSDTFLDVSAWPGPGGTYPDPTLSVVCDDTHMIVTSNGITHHEFVPTTPNDLTAQNYTFNIPLEPEWLDEPVDIALLGTVAVSISGVPVFGPNEAAFPDPFGDPVYNGIVDDCLGHPGAGGAYHYHALLDACYSMAPVDPAEASPVLGWSLDGYAIYGSRGCTDADCSEIVTYESGWVQIGDPETYAWDAHEWQASDDALKLDQCNGHVGPHGDYHYHATATFPYVLGCYHGVAEGGGGGGAGGAVGGDATGDVGGDAGGGDGGPPASCETDADCGGECVAAAAGCICANSPNGLICVPSCTVDADCPDDLTCTGGGFCVPAGGGGPGGGGAGGGGPG
jgi:hypothetical protein